MIDIVVVGDNPTAVEVRNHKCMTGPAVGILKQTMEKVGMPTGTDKVYYTTAVKEAIPKKRGYKVPKETILNARPVLLQEIKDVNPQLVIVLGKLAIQTLTGNTNLKVTEEYGRVREYDFLPGMKVVCVMHPALIIRAPADYKPFFASMQLVATTYKGNESYDTGVTTWHVLKTDKECDEALEFLANYARVAADMETTDLDYRVAEFCVLGICFEKNKVFVIPRELRHRAKDFLSLPNLRWIWHHGKYDRKVMWRRNLTQFDNLGWHIFPHQEDTMYMHYVLDETSAHDLGTLTKTFLQAKEYKYKMNQEFKAVTLET
ncbi:MAG: uracil-DNA glycosylase family protein, partial [Cellulosilyticaceae bacterium]